MGIVAVKDDSLTPLTRACTMVGEIKYLKKICIDIHFNASTNKLANGSEVFIPTKNTSDEVELADMFRRVDRCLSFLRTGVFVRK